MVQRARYSLYYSLFSAKAKVDPSQRKVYNSLAEALAGAWWAESYPSLFLDHVRHMEPAVTVLILNQVL